MSFFTKEYVNYEGRGELEDNHGNVITATFYCRVLYDDSVIGELFFSDSDNLIKIDQIIDNVRDMHTFFTLNGETKEGFSININKLYITNHGFKISEKGSRLTDTKFMALSFEINNKCKNITLVRYGVMCLNLLNSFNLNTNIGNIFFNKIKSHEEIIKEIKEIQKPCFTTCLEIEEKFNKNILHDKLIEYDITINKILRLSSLSQGITQNYFFVECYDNSNLVYAKYRLVKKRNQNYTDIILFPDLHNFLEFNMLSYTDELENTVGFSLALDWYLESLITDVIHSNIILLFTSIECLLSHYKKHNVQERILPPSIFNKFRKTIRKNMRVILREMNIKKSDRNLIYNKINELNRPSLDNTMKDFLKHYKIGYTDIYKNFKEIIAVRNDIIHKGISIEHARVSEIQDQIIVLLQRIFLSLLNYDGHDVIYNRLKGYPHDKFNRDPNGDHL